VLPLAEAEAEAGLAALTAEERALLARLLGRVAEAVR
jgi:hypothetical protein